MGVIDNVIGRLKQAAGDVADDPAPPEGVLDERKGEARRSNRTPAHTPGPYSLL